jgi:hypothetical protein
MPVVELYRQLHSSTDWGGVLTGVALALVFVPVGYRAVQTGRRWLLQRTGRRLLAVLDERNRVDAKRHVEATPLEESVEAVDLPDSPPALYLRVIELRNIRCFDSLRIEFERDGSLLLRTTVLGDNALGKSTLLRSVAIAMCNESDAVALMKSMPGPMIRSGKFQGSIRAEFVEEETGRILEATKTVTLELDGSERMHQESEPAAFPWGSVFVCGYGTQRTAAASASFDVYSPRQAVATLFDTRAVLQNPEVVLLRQAPSLRRLLQHKLLNVLLLDPKRDGIEETPSGLHFRGPFGDAPIAALSDGYRSTIQWLLDLFAWLIHARRLPARKEPAGILLIDEIEQHLHPRWQRHVIQRLSAQLPRMQIIVTTHTPLVASGMADVPCGGLIRFVQGEHDQLLVKEVEPRELKGKRADQVLTEYFDLATSRNPGSNRDLERLVQLKSAPSRGPDETRELVELSQQLESSLEFGETELERTVGRAVSEALETMLQRPPSVEFDQEAKRQLRELFGSEER